MKLSRFAYGILAVVIFICGMLVGGYVSDYRAEEREEIDAGSEQDTVTEEAPELLSENTYENIKLLKSYVDYAIEKYCDASCRENTYTYVLADDMLHHDTWIDYKYYLSFDLNKIITPELANDRYIFKVTGATNTLYVVIDTYRMKMFVYEYVKGETVIIGGETDREAELRDRANLDDCVISDWEDMWEEEYSEFTVNGWEYLTTPELDKMLSMNPDLYGMVTYYLQRYCEENGIKEQFYFEFPKDLVSRVTFRVFTVKVEGDFRTLYMDIDMDRNKVHVYEVEE